MNSEFTIDQRSFPKELQLLLVVLGFESDGDSLRPVDFEPYTDIDWDYFLKLANHHRVYSLVYAIIRRNEAHFRFPSKVMASLHAEYRRNAFCMLQLNAEMHRVSEMLQKRQVRTLVLKGPILAEVLYGDLALRTSKDLDILVAAQDVETTVGLLEEEGYICNELEPLNISQRLSHHISLVHPQKKIEVELHWRLNPHATAEPDFEALWSRRRRLGRSFVQYLSHEDLFFFLVSHGARHGWFRLRWLADIHYFLKQGADWKRKMIPILEQNKAEIVGGQAILLAQQLLNTGLPAETQSLVNNANARKLAAQSTVFIENMVSFTALPRKLVLYYKWYLFSLHADNNKMAYLVNQLYPNRRDIQMLRLPKSLALFYFPLRPFLWILRQFK